MAKEINSKLNFVTEAAAKSNTIAKTIYPSGCKYYLPCGKCDKTMEACTYPHPSKVIYDAEKTGE